MKKILATILAATAFAATALADDTSADVLVWYLDMEDAKVGQDQSFDTIKFWAVDSQNSNNKVGLGGLTYSSPEDLKAARYPDLSGNGPVGSGETISLGASDTSTQNYYTDLSGLQFDNGYTFLMALYENGNNDAVAWMEFPVSTSLAGIQDAITSLSNLEDSFIETPFPASFNMGETMVPEPTSGMLLLVGGALLALRRRRRG